MKTFFSIVSVSIRPESGEKIALGLLLSDGVTSLFDFSRNKLNVVKSLVDEGQFKFITRYFKSINLIISKVDQNSDQLLIPEFEIDKNLVITEKYIEYLSVYNQNMIVFSKPVNIDIKVENTSFIRLFEKFIDLSTPIDRRISHAVSEVKEIFLPKAKAYYSEERELSFREFPQLIVPVKVDLIGQNGMPVYAQFIDLERSLNLIRSDYFCLTQLKKVIKKGYGFLITAEPEKSKFLKQHDIWLQLSDIKDFQFVETKDVDCILDYAKEHGVTPF